MRKLMGCLAALFAVVGGTSAAMADGMSIKDGPAPVAEARTCDGGPFAGFYIGAAVGYFDQDTDYALGGPGVTVSSDLNGFTGGVYNGYNIQCGRLVVGIEFDYNWADLGFELGRQ